jgi:predicted transposase YbfD/YdcC
MVETERHIGDKVTYETRYYISSLASDAKTFGYAARGHWGIENGLHWILDVAFKEDDSRIRNGQHQQILVSYGILPLTLSA